MSQYLITDDAFLLLMRENILIITALEQATSLGLGYITLTINESWEGKLILLYYSDWGSDSLDNCFLPVAFRLLDSFAISCFLLGSW